MQTPLWNGRLSLSGFHFIVGLTLLCLTISTQADETNCACNAQPRTSRNPAPDPPAAPLVPDPEIWKDPAQPLDARIHDLMGRMTLAEKVSQLSAGTPAIPRLGIPAYHFGNEALHGLCSAGVATVFPQVIGMAATWDAPLIRAEGDVISTEARAKHNDYVANHHGDSGHFYGLTFWAPNVNIFRDPRWGRGQETYGEDPFLTAQMALAFVHGMQGDNPKYIKAMACVKHFAVHSGPEAHRFGFNAQPRERDLYETYLPAFQAVVQKGLVGGVMGAYSALYGMPDCANRFLLTGLLRQRWGFDGYVVSDCGAIYYNWTQLHFAPTLEESAADSLKAGCDICCGGGYPTLVRAVQDGLVTEQEIDNALYYALKTRFRLGLFDPPQYIPWSNLGIDQNDMPSHEALALKVADESIVLLKNDGVLPLNREKIKRLAVIGENADSVLALVGNYNGTPSRPVTILNGIRQIAGPDIAVIYEPGCPLALENDGSNKPSPKMTALAVAAAKSADAVIYVGGLRPIIFNISQLKLKSPVEANGNSQQLEGEQNKVDYQGFIYGDRTRIELPSPQEDLLKGLSATGKPVVFVNCSGSPMAIPWEARHLAAIVQAWYPGEQGGRAVAKVLFGDVNPAGRLPITFYASTRDLPPFDDYSMSNRTYRYFEGRALFAFGHGLSYTEFSYKKGALDRSLYAPTDTVKVAFDLKNIGALDGDEVAQVYFRHVKPSVPQPRLALCGFTRVHLRRGGLTRVTLEIPTQCFRYWDTVRKKYVVEPGKYQLLVGAASDDIRLKLVFKIAGTTGDRKGPTRRMHARALTLPIL
jgi:beta-glucosidase